MSKALNELKKATLASYLSKAGARVRSSTSLGKAFHDDAGRPLKNILKHSPNVYNPSDPEGRDKDPAQLKAAEADYAAHMDLSDKFKRNARNTIKGIALAGKKLAKEDAEQIDELKTSTLASVATKRFAQAQKALKDKDFGGYVKGMKKSQAAADATTPKSGWSPEDDKKNEEVVPVISAQEKYRQIKEAKLRRGVTRV